MAVTFESVCDKKNLPVCD